MAADTLLNATMDVPLSEDEAQSAQAALPFAHKSLKNRTGTALTSDIRELSFKKAHQKARQKAHQNAHQNARFYTIPVHQVNRDRRTPSRAAALATPPKVSYSGGLQAKISRGSPRLFHVCLPRYCGIMSPGKRATSSSV